MCCRQQLASEASRAEAAAAAAAEADAVWQEVLMQTEEDLEKRAETDSERLATLQRTAEEVSRTCLLKCLCRIRNKSRGAEFCRGHYGDRSNYGSICLQAAADHLS